MSLSNDLTDHASEVDIDEGEFMAMEERLRVLQTMKRRYGPTLDDVLAHLAFLQSKIEAYDNSEVIRENFGKREKELLSRLTAACARLSAARKKAGKALAEQIGQ